MEHEVERYWPKNVFELSNFKFYILNRKENKSIAIDVVSDVGYEGITFYKTNTGWELEPTKIGKGFIEQMGDAMDFTNDFNEALLISDQTQ